MATYSERGEDPDKYIGKQIFNNLLADWLKNIDSNGPSISRALPDILKLEAFKEFEKKD